MINCLVILFVLLQDIAMADSLRSEGKIYVVVLIFLIIISGLFLYLFRLEKKINSIEKEK
ncbi:MAG: CcmD family protein [Cytophagia bacterium]|jgi:CcmD family protein|nr:CcmD family protein [Cytophagia bacterium]|tara:strand:- start:485 stop:664 length:180 start_codon:yes stop_codon:yes gene_type:complete